MARRVLLGIAAAGMALAGVFAVPLPALLGALAAVTALLLACTHTKEAPKPSFALAWLSALTVGVVLFGAFLLKTHSPWGFLWLLGPGFLLAAPVFLRWFGESAPKP
ncbi:hypothetical protein HRbin09_01191 [bacterium HR09]|nr:hypothetical protein HRbin09_01191 [bacterium HR09]